MIMVHLPFKGKEVELIYTTETHYTMRLEPGSVMLMVKYRLDYNPCYKLNLNLFERWGEEKYL